MRIAILGTRGVPGRYGGFETFAEEFGARLVERGHEVTVYCRNGLVRPVPQQHRGMELRYLPAIRNKHLETLSHTFLSAMDAARHRFDVVYVCNSANAPVCVIPWLRRQHPVLNVDGLEWERAKWGRLAKGYYRLAARIAARLPVAVVTDAEVIQDYYRRHLGRETHLFPYGTEVYQRGHLQERLGPMGLRPNSYILYVSRMEPENNALMVVEAYRGLKTNVPLALVGDAPYASQYIAQVRAAADERVRFLGYRFEDEYHALQANALMYVQATEVGGTHPALVEALGHGNAVLAHDVPEHREVLGDAGRYFGLRDSSDLRRAIRDLLTDSAAVEQMRKLATARARERYSWDVITRDYESLFEKLIAPGSLGVC